MPTVEEPAQDTGTTANGGSPSGLLDPPSPAVQNRKSFHGGNTTKVLADLQAGVVHARTALENTRSQLKLAQRSVAQVGNVLLRRFEQVAPLRTEEVLYE